MRLTAACWIRLTGRTVCGAAWMMLDGSEVGLGALLEVKENHKDGPGRDSPEQSCLRDNDDDHDNETAGSNLIISEQRR